VSAPAAEPLGKLMLMLLHGTGEHGGDPTAGRCGGLCLDVQLASLAEVLNTQAAALER